MMGLGIFGKRYGAALGAILWLAAPAWAAQLSSGFNARVVIQTSCSVAATDLDFGIVGVITGSQTALAAVTVTCSAGTPFALSFSPSGIVTSFAGQMANGANLIAYNAVLLGANAGIGSATRTILGSLPPQPPPATGSYVDSRTIYLNY